MPSTIAIVISIAAVLRLAALFISEAVRVGWEPEYQGLSGR